MDINKVTIGKNPPEDIHVLIEIPAGGAPVKYELDKESGALFVDRFIHTAMFYPANYGFIPHTLSDDGDPCDVLVVSPVAIMAGAVVRSRPIGVLLMEDESGQDEKILAVPVEKLYPSYREVMGFQDLPALLLDQIVHFFEHYKDLEEGKWVKVKGWADASQAKSLIQKAIGRAKAAP